MMNHEIQPLTRHTLTSDDTGELWYSQEIPEAQVLKSIDILGQDLCSRDYWNIIGLDLKNEPAAAQWGSGPPSRDWHVGAETLGNRMLRACPQWTAFVEGIAGQNTRVNILGQSYSYSDWWGGGLQDVGQKPLTLSKAQKVVWSPHYYSPSVYPAVYFFASYTRRNPFLENYVERSDADLKTVVELTIDRTLCFELSVF